MSNTPILGDLYDLYTGVTGYDPITGQYLAGWERLANIAGAIPILGLSGANIRHGVHAAEALMDSGDELAQFIGAAGKCRRNSFSEETQVATDEGAVPIGEIDVGDRVLAWDELTDTTGYYDVSAAFSHVDATIVELTIDNETLKTTADHPFYVVTDAPWLAVGETEGRWVEAGALQAGDAVQKADGTTGIVAGVKVVAHPQRMYNLTVADAHTFFVGEQQWLVHNCKPAMNHKYDRRKAGYERPTDFTPDDNCVYCKKKLDPDTAGKTDSIEWDHLVGLKDAFERGGKDWTSEQWKRFANDLDNLVQSCKSCNASKQAKELFKDWVPPNMSPEARQQIMQRVEEIISRYGLNP